MDCFEEWRNSYDHIPLVGLFPIKDFTNNIIDNPIALIVLDAKNMEYLEAAVEHDSFHLLSDFIVKHTNEKPAVLNFINQVKREDPKQRRQATSYTLFDKLQHHGIYASGIDNQLPLIFNYETDDLPDKQQLKQEISFFRSSYQLKKTQEKLYFGAAKCLIGLGIVTVSVPLWNFLSPTQSFKMSFFSTDLTFPMIAPSCLLLIGIGVITVGMRNIHGIKAMLDEHQAPPLSVITQ